MICVYYCFNDYVIFNIDYFKSDLFRNIEFQNYPV